MTQFGMYSVTTPRNDPSPGHGQWDLAGAYRYLSEAYGGYHFNVLHGVKSMQESSCPSRAVQLLQLRQLGIPAIFRFLQYAVVL